MEKIRIINLAGDHLPKFVEKPLHDWVLYGADNLYPNKLIELLNTSCLHNAIITSKVEMSKGKELKTDVEDVFAKRMMNGGDYDMHELVNRLFFDYYTFGGFCFETIKSKDGLWSYFNHIPFDKVRSGKMDEEERISNYWYSRDWSKYRKNEYTPREIPTYSTGDQSLVYVKPHRPGCDYYPLPSYVGALAYIELDSEIGNFHLNNIKNGLAPSFVIRFPNVPTPDQLDEMYDSIKEQYGGSSNSGKFILLYGDGASAPEVTVMPTSQLDKQYTTLQALVMQNVLSGHKVTSPMLMGIKTEGQLGGNSEIETAYRIYFNSYIKPAQELIMSWINWVINDVKPGTPEIKIVDSDPYINAIPKQTE